MVDKLHADLVFSDGIHSTEVWDSVVDESARLAVVQTTAHRGSFIRQTAGVAPGFYIALGTTGQWQFVGDVSAAEAAAAAAALVATHASDTTKHALVPSATVHAADFTAAQGVLERWADTATLEASLPDGATLQNGARFGFVGVPSGAGGMLTVTCLGGKDFLGSLQTSLVFPVELPVAFEGPLVFVWDANVVNADLSVGHWIIESGYSAAVAQLLSGGNFVLVTKKVGGNRRLEAVELTDDTVLGVLTGSEDIVAVPIASLGGGASGDVVRTVATYVEVHWSLDNGDDANDGSAGLPVQSTARVRELADFYIRDSATVAIIIDDLSGGSVYELWDPIVLAEGAGVLTIDADPSTWTVLSAPYATTVVTEGGFASRFTVAGTPWTANQHFGRWLRFVSGPYNGTIFQVLSNTANTVDIISTSSGVIVGNSFEFVEPGVLVDGPNGLWQPQAGGDDAAAVGTCKLIVGGVQFVGEAWLQGAIALPFCRFQYGAILKANSTLLTNDPRDGNYPGTNFGTDRLTMGPNTSVGGRGGITGELAPGFFGGASGYIGGVAWLNATFACAVQGANLRFGCVYGRGYGLEVSGGGRFEFNSQSGTFHVFDIQTTTGPALYITTGGLVRLSQGTIDTASVWITLKKLASGVSVQISDGGQLIIDPGRFCRDIGRGAAAADIVLGSDHIVDNTYFWDGVNATRRAHLLSPHGSIHTTGTETSDHVVRDGGKALLVNAAPALTAYTEQTDPSNGQRTKSLWSTILTLFRVTLDAAYVAISRGALSVVGRSANSAGNAADISTTNGSGAVLRESGGVLGFGTVATAGLADDAVTDAKLRNSAGFSVIGKAATGTGDPADITFAADTLLGRDGSGDVDDIKVKTAHIADAQVTLAKLANLAQALIIGRQAAGGTGVPEALTATQVWAILGTLTQDIDANGFDLTNFGRAGLNLETLSLVSTVLQLDCSSPGTKVHVMTASIAGGQTILNSPASGKAAVIKMLLVQDSTPRTLGTWNDTIKWIHSSATAPTMPTGSGKLLFVTVIVFNVAGTTYRLGNYWAEP